MERFVLVALALATTVTSAAAAPMTAEEIKAAITGKKVTWKSKDGKLKGTTFFAANGTATVTGNMKDVQGDTGRWSVKGTSVCTAWTVLRGGKESCATWSKVSATSFVDDNNGTTMTVSK